MSKQRKAKKSSASATSEGPGGGHGDRQLCWVAKDQASPAKVPRRATEKQPPGSAGKADAGVTLEEFRSRWQPLPDEASLALQDYYFNSYNHFGIHEDMLKDQVRTGAYMRAILGNRHLFEGKTVLDVGSGTGILCLFAATAGAKRCIGIECSDIANFATQIAELNGLGDKITYVRGKVEEVEIPVDEVDIIVSEWMGYFLIYESMLDSVLFARDKWLKKGGLLFPDHAKLYAAGIEDADYKEEKVGFWKHLWGFDFSPVQRLVLQEPISDTVDQAAIMTSTECLLDLDLATCTQEDLDFCTPYALRATRKDFLHAIVVWFDVSFQACSPPVVMSTAPGQPYTHWKQTVLYLNEALVAHEGDSLAGLMAVRKCPKNPRDLEVKVSFEFEGVLADQPLAKVQYYRLR